MGKCQTVASKAVPHRVLLTDARNDAALERALRRLGRGDAMVFRHYHLPPAERHQRFVQLSRLARLRGVKVIGARLPRGWRADGAYGSPAEIVGRAGLRLATAHSLAEIGRAALCRADAILLSPVYPTRSHPGAPVLGAVRFLMLARISPVPVIALGGMTATRAARLPVPGWAAIDGITA
jgi:thiamine-phosphate pyrophosphorylase